MGFNRLVPQLRHTAIVRHDAAGDTVV
jgi:hypothetical protein